MQLQRPLEPEDVSRENVLVLALRAAQDGDACVVPVDFHVHYLAASPAFALLDQVDNLLPARCDGARGSPLLFNYFVAWDAGFEADTEVLKELADPDLLTGKDKLYTIAIPRYPVPGVSPTGQVPLRLKKGDAKSVTVRTHEPVRPRTVVVRIECADTLTTADLSVRLNGTILQNGVIPKSAQIFPEKTWPSLPVREKTLEFTADPALLKDTNEVLIQANRAITVEWVYVGVKH